jgi:adenylate kinase
MALNVIMMGAPGAGKGTQAGRFAGERGLPKISTGDILRDAMRNPGSVAPEVTARIARGGLVDDDTMVSIVRDRLCRADVRPGFVLDGFPRTVAQAEALDALMFERDNGPLVVVDVVVPEAELVRRLGGRRVCGACGVNAGPAETGAACRSCGGVLVQRADDDAQVVLERLKVYVQATRPVLDYYRERATFRVVNGGQHPDLVAYDLNAMVDDAMAVGLVAAVR